MGVVVPCLNKAISKLSAIKEGWNLGGWPTVYSIWRLFTVIHLNELQRLAVSQHEPFEIKDSCLSSPFSQYTYNIIFGKVAL